MALLPKNGEQGWTPYAWLIYLAIFLIYPIAGGAGAVEWTLTVLATLVFLVLYFRGFWLQGRRLLPFAGGIALIGALFLPFNPGGAVFFIYAAAFLGSVGRPPLAFRLLAGLIAFLIVETLLFSVSPNGWIPGVFFSLIIGSVNIHFAEVSRKNARLKLAQEEVERTAMAAERARIARDLHDLLGHSLSIITLKSELARKLFETEPTRAQKEITEVERISREAMAEVRRVVEGYREVELGVELAAARMALATADVDLTVESSPFDLAPAQETVLALALRESVTNVVRHARASRCRIRMRQEGGEFRLEVADDGRGGKAEAGSGLRGMAERVEALGGSVTRDGTMGTTVTVVIPLRAPSSDLGWIQGQDA